MKANLQGQRLLAFGHFIVVVVVLLVVWIEKGVVIVGKKGRSIYNVLLGAVSMGKESIKFKGKVVVEEMKRSLEDIPSRHIFFGVITPVEIFHVP